MSTLTDLVLAVMDDEPGSRIYFAKNPASGAVKIGRSRDVSSRMATLRTAIPDLVLIGSIPGGRTAEADLHASFAEERIAGEWFRPTHRLALTVATLIAAADTG